nr:MAG TPA: hypothetical protein [Bacteriophage sp.]
MYIVYTTNRLSFVWNIIPSLAISYPFSSVSSNYVTVCCCLYTVLNLRSFILGYLLNSKQLVMNSLIVYFVKHCRILCIFIFTFCLLFRHQSFTHLCKCFFTSWYF